MMPFRLSGATLAAVCSAVIFSGCGGPCDLGKQGASEAGYPPGSKEWTDEANLECQTVKDLQK